MKVRLHIPDLSKLRVAILHRPHTTVQSLRRQCKPIGLEAFDCWPELPPKALAADFVFFDADMGYDAQFPWKSGEAPMPMIALIGSEAPGRIEWSLSQGADAQILKPVGDGGVFSALLIARRAFEVRQTMRNEINVLRGRLSQRQTVVQAVTLLAATGRSEDEAYALLRHLAMSRRETIEEAAHRLVHDAQNEGGLHGQFNEY
ncbi:ANTAR domain-containing protein [Sulfitobacter sp. F26204]|uniref:ANTAR domain-containing response regulator n=1 Tax=Sulfitobacter sp. F26204 TaxID=2996014 RepID=UPI00225DE8B2|nr:ANTAR domain-containing protein [Sulfitobacter sp. F26204]MCX7560677.1 ANTAR domain-containing protein [Sulfitobacter sp. F26204]